MSNDALAIVRRELREQLRHRVDARGLASSPRTERRLRVREEALAVLRERGALLPSRELARVVNEVSDEVVGFGPIEFLLKDPTVTEVMVNGPDDVFVEREGRIERVPERLFEGEEPILHLIERIVGPLGLRVDQASPWVDARLPDGSRVHAIVPPLSLRGPVLTIRTFSPVPIRTDDLVRTRSMGPRALAFLAACIRGRANIVVSGGAGSGKTTLLGVLSGFIPEDERLITIEDAAELRLAKPHVISLEARPANVEGRGEVTVRELVRNALRMRPDRIIVGEVRGGEALDMLQAMNTGHEGSLSTAHANSCRHLLWRLETMAMMSDVDLPAAHIRNQVAAAIDLVVHLARLRDGRRVIWEIAEVAGTHRGEPVVDPLFRFQPRAGADGRFVSTGTVPVLAEILRERGELIDEAMFAAGEDVA
ncbi:MAG TPA: CpaF family protein [Actinomycetota bacterium]|nr:CpaF family protein [Actinomycetota bacterium]